jgi:hypothetical protein
MPQGLSSLFKKFFHQHVVAEDYDKQNTLSLYSEDVASAQKKPPNRDEYRYQVLVHTTLATRKDALKHETPRLSP